MASMAASLSLSLSSPSSLLSPRANSSLALSLSVSPLKSALPSSFSLHSSRVSSRRHVSSVRATADVAEAAVEESVTPVSSPSTPQEEVVSVKKKKRMEATPKKQLLLLRFIWLEKNIGIGLDQLVPGQGLVPLSPYMFWPRKDAWEELKALLDEKPWISRKRAIILLNQATDIINLWQQTTYKQ